MAMKKLILDACCGSRMFWDDHNNPNVLYVDNRILKAEAVWTSGNGMSKRYCTVMPDIKADFTALPFADESFVHIVFDPPHLLKVGDNAWMAKKYGKLPQGKWREMIHDGFAECWRVLKTNGTLVFKWNQTDIDFNTIFEVVGRRPMYGHICGKSKNTIWAVYVKLESEVKMANDFDSVLATCQRFQDIATWDPEHFNANDAIARIAELHKREIAAKDAEIAKRDALIEKLVHALEAYLLDECTFCLKRCEVDGYWCDRQKQHRDLIAKAREAAK